MSTSLVHKVSVSSHLAKIIANCEAGLIPLVSTPTTLIFWVSFVVSPSLVANRISSRVNQPIKSERALTE
jgi:hypothetical protein